MVKYRLSTLGTSCNWPRVISPTPGRSTLITSAPNHASNCVQVGPDCTWVKSKIRMPLSASLIVSLLPAQKATVPRLRSTRAAAALYQYRRRGLLLACRLGFQFGQAFAQTALFVETQRLVSHDRRNPRYFFLRVVQHRDRKRDRHRAAILMHRRHAQHIVTIAGLAGFHGLLIPIPMALAQAL